jgi:hypothetical protein
LREAVGAVMQGDDLTATKADAIALLESQRALVEAEEMKTRLNEK